ncbi:hypothetical protein Tco_0600652 [Tanacetum coccineum]
MVEWNGMGLGGTVYNNSMVMEYQGVRRVELDVFPCACTYKRVLELSINLIARGPGGISICGRVGEMVLRRGISVLYQLNYSTPSIKPNGDALSKCILEGPYTPSTVIIPAVPATDNSPAVPEQTTVETILNMSPENKAHFESKKEEIHLILTGIGDELYSTVDACMTAHELYSTLNVKSNFTKSLKSLTPWHAIQRMELMLGSKANIEGPGLEILDAPQGPRRFISRL